MQKHRLMFLAIAGAAFAAPALAEWVVQPGADYRTHPKAFYSLADELVRSAEHFGFSGAIAISRPGTYIYAKTVGHEDVGQRRHVNWRTSFRIGSVSKQFAAAAAMKLREQGKLQLDDTVCKYFRGFCYGHKRLITIHHLMRHSSGLRRAHPDKSLRRRYVPPAEWVQLAARTRLMFEPGTNMSYSNYGYLVLSAIIEKVADMPFERYLRTHLLSQARIDHTGLDAGRVGILMAEPKRVVSLEPRQYTDGRRGAVYTTFSGSGGMYSTAADLVKWGHALLSARVLSRESVQRIFTPGISGQGYGWAIRDFDHPRISKIYAKGGSTEGFLAQLWMIPEADLTMAYVSNVVKDPKVRFVMSQLPKLATGLDVQVWR